MPGFLKDLSIRRRSRSIFNQPPQPADSSGNSSINGDDAAPANIRNRNKSTSTLSSWFERSSPPTTLSSQQTNKSATNVLETSSNGTINGNDSAIAPPPSSRPTTSRPRLQSSQSSSRYSGMLSMSTLHGEPSSRSPPATSRFAPRVLSVTDGSWVHQKVLLISGQCADPQYPIDGTLTIFHHGDSFPSTQWPVCDSHFKALVHLQPGPNRLRFEFVSPKLSSPTGQMQPHSSWMNINFLPLTSSPPLQLCILVAKDSPETYDAVPERVEKEGNGLATAIRKFRMAAYLWQAFTAEQMNRNGFGRRCYRYEEEWQPGTLTYRDLETGQLRNEARIHVVRMEKTVEEIRDLDIAQHYESATKKGRLFDIAREAVQAYFSPTPSQPQYVSCMFLDTHWDKEVGTIRGHAALSGGDDSLKLAVFGSHCLQSYPSHIEEIVPVFSDCTRTDTNFVANEGNQAGSNWEAVNMGIGAHLHETGHLFGLPHQESGVMNKDYLKFNRTFTCREPFSTRTKQQGQRLCLLKDECIFHRLDALRFRFHPCFQRPTDLSLHGDPSIQIWSVESGTLLVTAASGIAWMEIYPEGDTECHHFVEYFDESSSPSGAPKQITLTEKDLLEHLPPNKRKKNLRLHVFSCAGGGRAPHVIPSFAALTSKERSVKLPDGRLGFKSTLLGNNNISPSSSNNKSQPQPQDSHPVLLPAELFLNGSEKTPKQLLSVRVYHGSGALLGLEFFYEGGVSEVFGSRARNRLRTDFVLDRMKAETVIGFFVRTTATVVEEGVGVGKGKGVGGGGGGGIDAIQILTSTGRRSELFGGGSCEGVGHTLIPPRGYSLAGIYGSHGAWVEGFGLIVTR